MNISVIGLGKLGLCTAACFAAAGHSVYGYDLNEYFRNELRNHRNPIDETDLDELLQAAWPMVHIVDSYEDAVNSSEMTLIIVPTPSQADGRFSNEYIIKVLEGIAPTIRQKESFHIVNIVSTVMPGSCDRLFKPLLEQATEKRCGRDFGLVYNPEFIALGSVIRDFLNPDMVLIGVSDERSGRMVSELYVSTCKNSPVMSVMSLINAEITKISLNCYVTMKISYANGLAAICEQVPSADIDVITAAVGADSRVGGKYLKGGIGFGGPCFPRDNIAFQAFAEEFGAEAVLGKAVVAINNSIPRRLEAKIASLCSPPAKVALLGLSYKADTHIVEESQSMILAGELLATGYRVALHDPKAIETIRQMFGDRAELHNDVYACTSGASVIVLLTDWPEYHQLDWQRIATHVADHAVVLDSWRIARNTDLCGLILIQLGIGKD